jgi:phospholipid-binding lipoprotein MlaA
MILFSGCSSKQISTQNETSKEKTVNIDQNNTDEIDEDDDFSDEFEDETVTEEFDPLSGYNRAMTSFNDGLYEYILKPVSNGYKFVVHKDIRSSVGKFFHNVLYPVRLVNNLLQGKFKNSAEETGRFVINSTVGVFGLFDPADSYFGLKKHNEDFGQTLGYYGVGSGFHIVLPILGPSNLRDAFSLYPDSLVNPIDYNDQRAYNLTHNSKDGLYLKSFKTINKTSFTSDMYDEMKKDAIDLYLYQKNIYEQYRIKQIKE